MRRLALAVLAAVAIYSPAHAENNRTTINTPTTIVTGNTFQTILKATNRWALTIENNNTNGDNCWIEFGVGITFSNATKANSALLLPGGSYTRYYPYIPSDEIEATCATASDSLYVDTQ